VTIEVGQEGFVRRARGAGRRCVSGTAAAALALALFAASPPSAAGTVHVDWRQFHGHPTHRGFNAFERDVGPRNVSNLSLAWIGNGATVGEDLVFGSSPTVVDGFVYFGTAQGQLLAFADECGGSECLPAWRLDLGESILNTPAVVNGVLYVGTASPLGKLHAFDVAACAAGSCSPLWTAKVGVGESSPTVANGVVYVGSQFGGVYAFAASGCGRPTCRPLWTGETGGYVINSPAVADGWVYAGGSDSKLYAFSADGCGEPSCAPVWTGRLGGPVYAASPAVVSGTVYVPSFEADPESDLNAFAAGGCGRPVCDPLWKGVGGSYMNSSPAIAYGNVYLGSGDGTLRVYPAGGCGEAECQALWIGQAAGPVATMESPPMLANGVVYVGENNSRIYAFPARGCGEPVCGQLWEFITQDPLVNSSPTMVNGTLYVSGTNFGTVPELYVFEPFSP
jgi:outer membrane protein assembly factor BamB